MSREVEERQSQRWALDQQRVLSTRRRYALIEDLVCTKEGNPHLVRGLMSNGRLIDTRGHKHIIEKMIKGKDGSQECPGVRGLEPSDWQRINRLLVSRP